jgi:histidinol phosphatase-like PHP family hydrolase
LSRKFDRLLASKYLFHLHTHHTDALLSVNDYLRFASANGYDSVIFTEHVNRDLHYDFDRFVDEVEDARRRHPEVTSIVGVEAKILPEGELDIPEKILDKVELIGIACHSFPGDSELYFRVMEKILTSPLWGKEKVWVHPGLFFLRFPELKKGNWLQDLRRLTEMANRSGVYGETNMKYGLPTSVFPSAWFDHGIIGWDLHHMEDLERVRRVDGSMV